MPIYKVTRTIVESIYVEADSAEEATMAASECPDAWGKSIRLEDETEMEAYEDGGWIDPDIVLNPNTGQWEVMG